jgi:quinol monooxygenase YgiN
VNPGSFPFEACAGREASVTISARIHYIANGHVRPGRREEILAVFHDIIPPTRLESGCLKYELHENTRDPLELCMISEWQSDAHLDAHLAAPHMQAALPKLIDCCVEPPSIKRYRLLA